MQEIQSTAAFDAKNNTPHKFVVLEMIASRFAKSQARYKEEERDGPDFDLDETAITMNKKHKCQQHSTPTRKNSTYTLLYL